MNRYLTIVLFTALSTSALHGGTVQVKPVGSFTFVEGVTERSLLRDLNLDGLKDLVLRIDFPLGIRVKLSGGDGTFGPTIASSTFSDEAFGFAVGDVSGDDVPDAIIGNPNFDGVNLAVLIGQGDGSFAFGTSLNNGSSSFPLVGIGDVNGDQVGDIVSNTFTSLSVIASKRTDGFGPPIISGWGGTVGDILPADLDNDGDLDSVQVEDSLNQDIAHSTVIVNRGAGTGSFTGVQDLSLPVRVGSGFLTPGFALARLNNDALPDLVVFGLPGTDSGPGGLFVLRNTGGQFVVVLHQTYAQLGGSPQDVGVGDLDGDDLDDVVLIRNTGNHEVRVSDGEFGFMTVPLSGPSFPNAVLVGHFTGSPLPDLIIIEQPISPTETFTVFENITAQRPTSGDLDADGDVDGFDLALLLGQWGSCPTQGSCAADLDGNGIVNGLDLAMLLGSWSA